jgi:hypothetical protein
MVAVLLMETNFIEIYAKCPTNHNRVAHLLDMIISARSPKRPFLNRQIVSPISIESLQKFV